MGPSYARQKGLEDREAPVKRILPVKAGLAVVAALGLASCSSLDDRPNVGPCPVVGSLYDAQRLVEVMGAERHENVGFTGAIESVKGYCRYTGKNPITMEVDIVFAFGKGPQAKSDTRTYSYWTAVTRRDSSVLAKLNNEVKVTFPKGVDEVRRRVTVNGIVIPRATETISGVNFEVLVGFDLTDEQLEFNRSGKRFLMNVGVELNKGAPASAPQQQGNKPPRMP
jgi:hypothetical protein